MKKSYWLIWSEVFGAAAVLLLVGGAAQAQVKIGNNPASINPGSLLELESTNRGVFLPRVALTDRATWTLNGNQPVEGMMVYNTNPSAGVNGLQAGMAVWKSGQWVSVDETPYFHVNSAAIGNSTLANSGATGAESLAAGPRAIASAPLTVAMGNAATASGQAATAIGNQSLATGNYSVALGDYASAVGHYEYSVGTFAGLTGVAVKAAGDATYGSFNHFGQINIGANSGRDVSGVQGLYVGGESGRNSSGWRNIAIGMNAGRNAHGDSNTAVGGNAGESVIGNNNAAFGNYAGRSVLGVDNVAIGLLAGNAIVASRTVAVGATATPAADDAVAIGTNAGATVQGSIALGAGSVSDRAIGGTQGTIPAGTDFVVPYNTTDRTLLGAVSVGNATSYRQITNVADGTEQQDAVTVRQLTGALSAFSTTPTKYFHANSTRTDSAAVGEDSIAIGPQTIVNGNNGIGMGNGATVQASAPGGIAIGQASTSGAADAVALGTQASANAVQGVAIGAGSSVTQAGGVALGAGSVASTAAGVAGYIPPSATAEQRTAIGATTGTLAAVSVGDAASGQFRQITGVAAGTVDSDAVNVSQLKAVQGQVAQIDQGTVKYDTKTDGTTNYNSVTMGGSNTTGPVTVHNVAAGVEGTDAVNVNQLNGATSKLNSRIDNLADQVSANTRMLSGGIAASAAMAVVTPVEPGRYHVSGAVAGYNGQAGVGFNLLKRSDSGQTTLHAGVGWGSGGSKAIVRVGFGLSFD
ncbi:YadA family autotransporter adhesin [Variovorax sp. LT2P21]|uniref:YadA family autotransporter adhesin n=1 Tax=Variovorax sp. LT2P21 TaxID=3443731 RepID=UPI003F45AD0F